MNDKVQFEGVLGVDGRWSQDEGPGEQVMHLSLEVRGEKDELDEMFWQLDWCQYVNAKVSLEPARPMLRGCAHCGSAQVRFCPNFTDDRWRVLCGCCGMSTPWCESMARAAGIWNERSER